MREQDRLLDEHVLRRALRLDQDEVPPRIDPALLAAASRAAERGARTLVIAVAGAFIGGWIWSEAFRAIFVALADATGVDPLATAIGLVDLVAQRVAPLAAAATEPAVPIAILVAALVAVAFEHRGRIRVTPS